MPALRWPPPSYAAESAGLGGFFPVGTIRNRVQEVSALPAGMTCLDSREEIAAMAAAAEDREAGGGQRPRTCVRMGGLAAVDPVFPVLAPLAHGGWRRTLPVAAMRQADARAELLFDSLMGTE